MTLHTGVSSLEVETDVVEDQVLYAEPFAVPPRTAEAVNAARREGRPVIAVGTTATPARREIRRSRRAGSACRSSPARQARLPPGFIPSGQAEPRRDRDQAALA